MKTKKLLFLFCLMSASLSAQNKLWYFGDNQSQKSLGIFFNGGSLNNRNGEAVKNFYESVTVQSDALGNLLFYSDGIFVWDKNHNKMPSVNTNGTKLQGTDDNNNGNVNLASAVQGAFSFLMPGSSSKYYLFTTQSLDGTQNGWRYHIIDMALNGGLGDVSSKNNLLINNTTEMMAVTGSCDSIWVVTHHRSNNNFYSVLVTANGVGSVVTSSLLCNNQWDNGIADNPSPAYSGSRGSLAFNPQGTKLAMTGGWPTGTHVVNFNKTTGVVSGPELDILNVYDDDNDNVNEPFHGYGLEWSPDGNILYVSSHEYEGIIRRNFTTNITENLYFPTRWPSAAFGEIATGEDGKLYIGRRGEDDASHLAIIANPNAATAAACGFTQNGYNVGLEVQPGLPQYFTCSAQPCTDLDTNLNNLNVSICAAATSNLAAFVKGSTKAGTWSVIGSGANWPSIVGSTFTTTSGTAAGNYTVRYTLTSTQPGCATFAERVIHVKSAPVVSLSPKSICLGDSTTFDAGNTGATFVWSNLGTGNLQTTKAKAAGTYTVAVTVNGCTTNASAVLTVNTASVNINNTTVCPGSNATLNTGGGYSSYTWSGPNGYTNTAVSSISVSTIGKYFVSVVAANTCKASDSAIVSNHTLIKPNIADVTVCAGVNAALTAPNHSNHVWSGPNGFSSSSGSVATAVAGEYYLQANDINSCLNYDTINVVVNPNPSISLKDDTTQCFSEGETYTITLPSAYNSVVWSDNSSNNTYLATSAGTYWVTVGDANNCFAKDTIVLSEKCEPTTPCYPNVITPNGDTYNDVFESCKPYEDVKMKSMQMDIYNRWGIKIFSTNDKYPMWDGKFNGNIVSDGVYYYVVKYTNSANDSGEQTGFVQVIY